MAKLNEPRKLNAYNLNSEIRKDLPSSAKTFQLSSSTVMHVH